LAAAWAWSRRDFYWIQLDLRSLDWTPGFEKWLPFATLAVLLPLILLAGVSLVALARGRGSRLGHVPWRVAAWTAPVLAVPMIVWTAGIFVADTARTDGWTLTRQNIDTLRGDLRCGLADEELVADRSSARPLAKAGPGGVGAQLGWLPPAPIRNLPRFALGPSRPGLSHTPWFNLVGDRPFGLLVAGAPGPDDTLMLEWGRRRSGTIEALDSDPLSIDATPDVLSDRAAWHFFTAGELPSREPGASLVRVDLISTSVPSAAVAVTAPVTYASKPLAQQLNPAGSRTLLLSPTVTYFPCVKQPRMTNGIVEVPDNLVTLRDAAGMPVAYGTSPFVGLLDLYPFERLPWDDETNPPVDLTAFKIDRRIPGAKVAPPVRRTFTS
jgi:hypothetical protein